MNAATPVDPRPVDWDDPGWGGHVHADPAGSWVTDRHTDEGADT